LAATVKTPRGPLGHRIGMRTRSAIFTTLTCTASFALALSPRAAHAEEEPPRPTLSVATELVPIVFSAIAGDPGGQLTVGLGRGHLQLRAVGLAYTSPKFLLGNDAFDRDRILGGGIVADAFLGKNLDGAWVGLALEGLHHTLRHERTEQETSWTNFVAALSVGYLWRFSPGFFVSPRAGANLSFTPRERRVAGDRFEQPLVAPEISLRLGWYFPL